MKKENWFVVGLLAIGIFTRFLPHPSNFTAIGAVAIFGGLYLPKKWAVAGPLIAMFVSDIFLGFYSLSIMLTVYACFAISTLIGRYLKNHKKFLPILAGTTAGSVMFFIFTNLAVFIWSGLYAHTFSGLVNCYYLALPFFKNSLMGDLIYTFVLVGAWEMATFRIKQHKQEPAAY